MAKPTQSVQKRQRELKKHLRRQEKERRRAEREANKEAGGPPSAEGMDVREFHRDLDEPESEDSPSEPEKK